MPPPDSNDPAKPKVWQKATGPSAGLVQQHYVSIRQEALSRQNPDLLDDALSALAFRMGKPRNSLIVPRAFETISKKLMEADLTINFEPERWFATENTYESYTQMYERSTKGGITFLDNSDWKNPATSRALADDRATFPQEWRNQPATPTHRGLMPGQQSGQRIMNQMEFGGQRQAFKLEKGGTAKPGVMSKNPHFNS